MLENLAPLAERDKVDYNDSMLDSLMLAEIRKIIFRFVNPREVRAFIFGSRATGGGRRFSDIDIGIEGKKQIDSLLLADIKEAFEESHIPYIVEVVDFSRVSDRFKIISGKKIISLN
jgi:predicted nucleotidyltransferase